MGPTTDPTAIFAVAAFAVIIGIPGIIAFMLYVQDYLDPSANEDRPDGPPVHGYDRRVRNEK